MSISIVVAIGNGPNPLIPQTTPDIATRKGGNILADEKTLMTSMDRVFAGGDIVLGAATVILAMGQGRQAAQAIDDYFHTGDPQQLAGELREALKRYLERYPAMPAKQVRNAMLAVQQAVDEMDAGSN